MVPTLSLLLMIPATLLLFGPIGIYLGDGVNWLYYYIMNLSPILLGGFIGGIWCVLVILGLTVGLCQLGLMMSLEQDGKFASVCGCSELFKQAPHLACLSAQK